MKHKGWILKVQKTIIAPDFPWYAVKVMKCSCGCGTYAAVLDKKDLGYSKNILHIEYNSALEAMMKFEQLVRKCEDGTIESYVRVEGQSFD